MELLLCCVLTVCWGKILRIFLDSVGLLSIVHSKVCADLSQLCGHLVVFRGEFWSVKFIETRDLFQVCFNISKTRT